jgi:hypothetical protein
VHCCRHTPQLRRTDSRVGHWVDEALLGWQSSTRLVGVDWFVRVQIVRARFHCYYGTRSVVVGPPPDAGLLRSLNDPAGFLAAFAIAVAVGCVAAFFPCLAGFCVWVRPFWVPSPSLNSRLASCLLLDPILKKKLVRALIFEATRNTQSSHLLAAYVPLPSTSMATTFEKVRVVECVLL